MKNEIWIHSGIYYTKIVGNVTECKITSLQLDMSKMSYNYCNLIDVSKAFHSMKIHTPLEDILFAKEENEDCFCRDIAFYTNPISCYNDAKENIVMGWDIISAQEKY